MDEWTAEQLEVMKVSGNGNAASYFKKHGISDSQMQVRSLIREHADTNKYTGIDAYPLSYPMYPLLYIHSHILIH
ncbi:hypothetical protein EON63_17850, partial [archaeon]